MAGLWRTFTPLASTQQGLSAARAGCSRCHRYTRSQARVPAHLHRLGPHCARLTLRDTGLSPGAVGTAEHVVGAVYAGLPAESGPRGDSPWWGLREGIALQAV